jgi:hypothetical protein
MPRCDHLSPAVLRQGGLGTLARSVPPALAARARKLALSRQPVPVETQFRWYTRLWAAHNRIRYDVPTRPWATIEVDPAAVTHYVGTVELPWGLGRVRGGDWDRESNRHRVDELPRYRGLVQYFEEGRDWEDTDYYEHLRERYTDNGYTRGHDEFESFWRDRREAHETLYRSIQDEGYRPNAAVDHEPECAGSNPPPMPHGHFAIFPEGNYRGGINIWIGKNGNCIWVGEEHSSNWCTRVCGPNGGLPSLADLRDAFEEAINQAADAAGIAVPAIVVTALAYYLAASTLAPPTGVPLV